MEQQAFQRVARVGYAARGVVYVLVGGLSLIAALGSGRVISSKEALATLLAQPLGVVWVSLIGIGLLAFAAWRFAQSVLNADNLGKSRKATFKRIAYLGSGAAHIALASAAVSLVATGSSGQDGETSARGWAAESLSMPFGQWLTAIIACGLCLAGFAIIGKGVWGRLDNKLMLNRTGRRWFIPLGRIGFTARGLVFVAAGWLLFVSAMHANPDEARGMTGALQYLRSAPYGSTLLCLVSAGLFLFGAFQFAIAYYRQIDASKVEGKARELKAKVT